jgi:hypothetical protein
MLFGKKHYWDLMNVLLAWQTLAAHRRSGQEHNINCFLPHWHGKSLTVWCPSCPQIGFNIEKKLVDEAPLSELCINYFQQHMTPGLLFMIYRHRFKQFWSLDGNMHLQQKRKKYDELDTALNAGNAYFVEMMAYRSYLRKAKNYPKVRLFPNIESD